MNKIGWIFSALVGLTVLLFAADLFCAGTFISPFHWNLNPLDMKLLGSLRLPKALTAIIAGAALSVSGLMMQTLFRNPLAGPYILGVSGGAGLGVAVVTLLTGSAIGCITSVVGCGVAAIIGSTAVLFLMLALSGKVKSNVSLLLVGMMLGSIASALVNMLQNFANPDSLKLFVVWTLGSVANVGWGQMTVMGALVLVALVLTLFLLKPLNGLLLGENYARGLGVNVRRTRFCIVAATGLLAGGVTAFCGPIAFVGVAVPHIARGIFATANHRITVPASALMGASMLLVCDLVSSAFTYPLPISTVSAIFGAPVIIWIILKKS